MRHTCDIVDITVDYDPDAVLLVFVLRDVLGSECLRHGEERCGVAVR